VSEEFQHFDVYCDGQIYCHLDLQVLGKHNLLNALGAAGAAWMLGIDGSYVSYALAGFTGADRRMQKKGTFNSAELYDDYAHHPDELRATIEAVRSMHPKRLVVAFQPHTYTRTSALFSDFVRELKKVDVAVIAEIYAARERNSIGISSKDLCAEIPGSIYCATLQDVTACLQEIVEPDDVVLTVGAGDIFKAGEALLK
jgi:UDP-N-acetylmuramate--alanine ligase